MSPVPRPSYPMYPESFFEAEARASGVPAELAPKIAAFMRRVMDKQVIDERLNYQWITDNLGGGGGKMYAELVVAASDSSEAAKAVADYVCDGSADNVEIQAAIDALDAAQPFTGRIILMAGTYELADVVTVTGGMVIQGQGHGNTFVYNYTTTNGAFDFVGLECGLYDLWVDSNGSFVVYAGGEFTTSGTWIGAMIIANESRVSNCFAGYLTLSSSISVVSNVQLWGLTLMSSTFKNRVTGCILSGQLSLDGVDNSIDACSMVWQPPVTDNTGEVVSIDGTRNSFTNNQVRGGGGAPRPQYGVEVQAGATGARVEANDLRPGASTWGTAAFNDLGAGTLTTLANDV